MSGTHEDLTRELEANGSSDRAFGLVFACAFAFFAFWPLVHHRPMRFWALAVSALFLLIALTRPGLLAPLNVVWTKLGWLLQKVVHPVVMGIMFYLIFTPAGLILRRLGKD